MGIGGRGNSGLAGDVVDDVVNDDKNDEDDDVEREDKLSSCGIGVEVFSVLDADELVGTVVLATCSDCAACKSVCELSRLKSGDHVVLRCALVLCAC